VTTLTDAVRISPPVTVEGVWQRHAPARYAAGALEGRRATSRWGRADGFPVLYLGRPLDSVIVEAYRHLVNPVTNPDIVKHAWLRLPPDPRRTAAPHLRVVKDSE
jgi:hypothetical protein